MEKKSVHEVVELEEDDELALDDRDDLSILKNELNQHQSNFNLKNAN